MPNTFPVQIEHLFISPGHNFFYNKSDTPGTNPIHEVPEAEAVAGAGLRGDRFFNFKDNYRGQVSFISGAVFEKMKDELGHKDATVDLFRRNIVITGINLNNLIGQKFTIAGVEFEGAEECSPCKWMDKSVGPGTKDFLKGRGGLRARVLSTGIIPKGHVNLSTDAPITYDDPTEPVK